MKNKFQLILVSLFLLLLSSCALFKQYSPTVTTKSGESPILNDATPPSGYNPGFINQIDTFRVNPEINYKMNVMHTEIDSGKVKIWFNITSDKGLAYIKANIKDLDSIWCITEEKIDSFTYPIKNYELYHYTDEDSIPNAYVFVLDHSGSMGASRAYAVQNAIGNLIRFDKKEEDAFAVIKYDENVVNEVPLTNSVHTFQTQLKINGLSGFGGFTAINDGLNGAASLLSSVNGFRNKAAIIFTDGMENSSSTSTEDLIKNATTNQIKIFTIDFGDGTDGSYLQNIADQTGGNYYHIYGTNEFNYVFKDIYKRMENIYVFEYTPSFFGQVSFTLQLCNDTNKVLLHHQFEYKPDVGNFTLVNIYFDSNKSFIKKEYNQEVVKLAGIMKQYPNIQIEIAGHTDNQGSDAFNENLSYKRANAVKEAIVKQGIDEARIKALGYGEKKPVTDNDSPESRAKNRRTEFIIVGTK